MAAFRSGDGKTREHPKIIGQPNGAEAILIETTGAYEGLQVGEQRWVTGSRVEVGLGYGVLVELHTRPVQAEADVKVVVDNTPEPAAKASPTVTTNYDPTAHTVKDVLAYIDKHPKEADAIVAVEKASAKPRVSITG